jgi:hypothetical protein
MSVVFAHPIKEPGRKEEKKKTPPNVSHNLRTGIQRRGSNTENHPIAKTSNPFGGQENKIRKKKKQRKTNQESYRTSVPHSYVVGPVARA